MVIGEIKKKILEYAILGLAVFGSCGCLMQNQSVKDTIESESEKNESDTDQIENYVHGDDGYFSLVDEGLGTPVKSQIGGTCWVTAASTSMESAYKIKTGTYIEINPLDILESVYGTGKEEGYFIKEDVDGLKIGGWAWQITETLSNGFGEYLLIESDDYSQVDIESFKDQIRKKGAMNVAINDANSSLFGSYAGYKTLNDSNSDDFDHEVTIVGWDDNFPKEYFRKQASKNGAWLCQNTRSDSCCKCF